MSTPGGDMVVAGVSSATLGMTFARDAGAVRVTGSVDAVEPSDERPHDGDPVHGRRRAERNGRVSMIGPRGDVEVSALPQLTGDMAQMSPFASIAHELFLTLPENVVEPGGIWVDSRDMDQRGGVGENDIQCGAHLHPRGRHRDGWPNAPEFCDVG